MLNVRFASESDPDTDVSLSFFAADRILGEIIFSERFLLDLGKIIQHEREYRLNETLKGVKLPSGQDISGQFVFVIAKSHKEGLDFGILLNQLESGGYHILGLWPRDFAEICKSDREIFEFLMFRLINTPEFFAKVTLYRSASAEVPSMEVKKPALEAKPTYAAEIPVPPAPEIAYPPIPPSTDMKAAIKPEGVQVAPPVPASAKAEEVAVELPPELLEGRCPFCKAVLPEPRLKVIERGGNTFCPKCLKILKGIKAPVDIKPVSEVSITEITKKELNELVQTAEQDLKRKDYAQAASNYRKASEKAKLLDKKDYAKELSEKAEECAKNLRVTKIEEVMKTADDFFNEKQYENAIKEYRIAIDLAKKANDAELLKSINTRIRKCAELIVTDKVKGLIAQGDQSFKEENYDEAKKNYAEALELEKRLGEREIIATLEKKITDCDIVPLKRRLQEASGKAEKQFKVDKFEEAAQFYKEAASIASQLKDIEAQRYFEQKIIECRNGPLVNEIQKYVKLGDTALQTQAFEDATESYKEALNAANKLGDKEFIKEIQDKIEQSSLGLKGAELHAILTAAADLYSQKDYNNAKSKYRDAISVAKEIGKSDTVKTCEDKINNCDLWIKLTETTQKAESNYQSQNLEMALTLYKDALNVAQKLNDSNSISKIESQIKQIQKDVQTQSLAKLLSTADKLMNEQNYHDAKEKLSQAKSIATQINDSAKLQEISQKIDTCNAALQEAEAEAQERAEEEARRKAEEQTRLKAEAEAKAHAEEDARRQAEESARRAAEAEVKAQATSFLCPFCDAALPESTVNNLKKGYNVPCPSCNKVLGRRALDI